MEYIIELTNKQKIEAFIFVKKNLPQGGGLICKLLQKYIHEKFKVRLRMDDLRQLFPKFFRHKPPSKNIYEAWWKIEDKKYRIEMCEFMISYYNHLDSKN